MQNSSEFAWNRHAQFFTVAAESTCNIQVKTTHNRQALVKFSAVASKKCSQSQAKIHAIASKIMTIRNKFPANTNKNTREKEVKNAHLRVEATKIAGITAITIRVVHLQIAGKLASFLRVILVESFVPFYVRFLVKCLSTWSACSVEDGIFICFRRWAACNAGKLRVGPFCMLRSTCKMSCFAGTSTESKNVK